MKFLFPVFLAGAVFAQQPIAPTGTDGQALNLGFEKGTLEGWTATGDAFAKQPVKGDTVAARKRGASQHAGEYWIGGYENGVGDGPTGTLTSPVFKVTQPWASFLVAGGGFAETRVDVVTKDDGKVIHTARGVEEENMGRSVVDLRKFAGREIFVRVVDESKKPWGHINFDDFVFHAEEPKFPQEKLAKKPAPALTPDTVTYAGLPADKAAEVAKVPEGYELKVFASEPEVINPIAFCIDDRARIWVIEGMTYPTRAKDGEGKDRILVFEDTDGDGKADKRTVFLEGLNLGSGIEVGYGGVWVGAAPYLYFYPVSDWDNPKPAGAPKVVLDGWGYQDTHEMLNTFHWGPDGWLYGCHGVFTQSEVGKPGTPKNERVKINAGYWRYHPTKEIFEVFAHGTSNPWGIDWNADGELFAEACVIPHMWHIIQGARYQRQAGQHFDPHTYGDIETIADHRHYLGANPHGGNGKSDAAGGGHAHAGLVILQHPSWPDSIRGNLLMGNIHGSRINMDIPVRQGSGYVAKHGADFINFDDKASQIIDLREGPDGTLFMIDWYDLNQCHVPRREAHDYTTGRIFRLAKKGMKMSPQNLSKLSEGELFEHAITAAGSEAKCASRMLQERNLSPEKSRELIKEFAGKHPELGSPEKGELTPAQTAIAQRMLAIRAASGFPDKAVTSLPPAVTASLAPELLAKIIYFSVEDKAASAEVLQKFGEWAKDAKSPVIRLALASACLRLTIEERKPIITALLAHEEDKDDHNLPLMYWYAAEPVVAKDAAWAGEVLGFCKIPKVNEYIARRLAE